MTCVFIPFFYQDVFLAHSIRTTNKNVPAQVSLKKGKVENFQINICKNEHEYFNVPKKMICAIATKMLNFGGELGTKTNKGIISKFCCLKVLFVYV